MKRMVKLKIKFAKNKCLSTIRHLRIKTVTVNDIGHRLKSR